VHMLSSGLCMAGFSADSELPSRASSRGSLGVPSVVAALVFTIPALQSTNRMLRSTCTALRVCRWAQKYIPLHPRRPAIACCKQTVWISPYVLEKKRDMSLFCTARYLKRCTTYSSPQVFAGLQISCRIALASHSMPDKQATRHKTQLTRQHTVRNMVNSRTSDEDRR
jgi:hypothetical protein